MNFMISVLFIKAFAKVLKDPPKGYNFALQEAAKRLVILSKFILSFQPRVSKYIEFSVGSVYNSMKAKEELQGKEGLQMPKFEVSDLESLNGKYDTVVCLDVLIHYPQNKADGMIAHLASLAENRVILSFAPKTFYYDLLKRIGELFPGPSKATRAYLHSEADIEQALQKVGWKIRKRGLTTTQFYFSRIVEAVRA
ncbi:magnesium protoporphyrin IX methyltransferase, chloroplastic [Tanacetum coccineum]